MVPTDMPTDTQAELEKKITAIGEQEQARAAQSLAQELNIPFVDLQGLPIDPDALRKVSEADSRASGVALVQAKGPVGVAATLDPRTPEAQRIIRQLTDAHPQLKTVLVAPATMKIIWDRYSTIKTAPAFEAGAVTINDEVLVSAQKEIQNISDLQQRIKQASITQLLELLIAGALTTHASDIHFEPEAKICRLRYRLDGLLHEVASFDLAPYQRVLNRIKVLAKLKLNVTRAPQDGRFTIRQSNVDIEVRVSVLPSEYGESIVMRLLDPRGIHAKLETLGMRPDVLEKVRALLARPQGALLTTGPTGSGKTTTLYAFLNELNMPDMKIITVEDPIEYHIAGVNQTQVDPAKGYTFATGLRAIVRQDPDIILIGEIRDQETADIALEAALTGHMVLSTLHTNDAAGTIPRLVDIGAKPETIAPALTMAMGQRLLRRLCNSCKKKATLPAEDLERIRKELPDVPKNPTVYEPGACVECNNTGYLGRIGVYEVFEVTRPVQELILAHASANDIRDLAVREGMITMLQDGYHKLLDGITSLEEIRRVLG